MSLPFVKVAFPVKLNITLQYKNTEIIIYIFSFIN